MKKLFMIIAALAVSVLSMAQEVNVQAPNLVGVGEQFTVTFVISGEDAPSDFNWNPGSDFKLVWGPTTGRSTSTTIVNGKRTKSSQYTYAYVLMPTGTGTFNLPQATFSVKGRKYSSRAHSIEVVSDSASQSRNQSEAQSQRQTGSVSDSDVFMKLSVSKRRAVVGEPLTATLKLYQRVNIRGYENAKFPDFHGFWSQETYAPNTIEFHRESIDDKIYNVATLRSWNIIPQQAGDLVIDPSELVCVVNIKTQSPSTGSIFDDFFQDDYRTLRKRITTDPLTIHVSKLPEGAPASFTGAVGKFKMSVSLSKDSLNVHDAASLKLNVTGTGNVALLEAPKVNFPPDFEQYDVKTTDIKGGKSFEYPFIPRSYGDFTIPSVEFSYYDTESGKYVTLSGGELQLSVKKGSASSEDTLHVVPVQVNRRKDVKDLASDIRFISVKAPVLKTRAPFFIGSAAFWCLLVALVAVAALIYFLLRFVEARRLDVVGSKTRGATKMARKRLARADAFLKKELYSAFYEELHKALLGYVSDKLTLDASALNRDNIAEHLRSRMVPESLVNDYLTLLDECEYARYSPDAGHEAMNATYEKALGVISGIDDSMKKKSRGAAAAAIAALFLTATIPAIDASAAEYPDSLWNAGVEAYSNSRYQDAANNWNTLVNLGIEDDQLYYNLGNAYFKMEENARAILCYERALKLNPSNDDAAYNLEFARAGIQDQIVEIPDFFLKRWVDTLSSLCSSNAWSGLAFALLALGLAMVLLFLLARSRAANRTGFVVAIVSLLLSLSCFLLASRQKSNYLRSDSAVVMTPVCTVKSAPSGDNAKDLFVLHEGTKVKILDTVDKWLNIELADGRQGWMLSSDLELI